MESDYYWLASIEGHSEMLFEVELNCLNAKCCTHDGCLEKRWTRTNWGGIKWVRMIQCLHLCLVTLESRHCWGGIHQTTYVSAIIWVMLINFMLMFIHWYNRHVLLMLREKQNSASFRNHCSSHDNKQLLFHHPEFRVLSFTHTVEMEKPSSHNKPQGLNLNFSLLTDFQFIREISY